MAEYIFVGADPARGASHYGGVLTLSRAFLDHAKREGHSIAIINTLRTEFGRQPLIERLRGGWRRVCQLLRRLKTQRFCGVIITSGAGFSFFERVILAALCRWYCVNSVLLIVDGWFLDVRGANRVVRSLTGFLLRIPNKLASTGSRWADLFAALGVEPSRIVPIHYWSTAGSDVSEAEKQGTTGRPVRFIFVGWMIKEKGIQELILAIEELRKKHQFYFTFVGGGLLLEEVRQKISDARWGEEVSALGWVSDAELRRLLSLADVFVLPSYAEGFPLSLVEAFSTGLPAIASDVGGIADSLKDGVNGYLIQPRQVTPLADAMERYLDNPGLISVHSRASLQAFKSNHMAGPNCQLILDSLK